MNIHRSTNRFGAAVAALLLAFTAMPASAQEVKVGVVNFQRLLLEAPQTRAALESLEEEFAPRQRSGLAKQQELKDLTDKYQRDAAVMGEAERENMERDLRDRQRELQRLNTELSEDANLRRNEELGKVQRQLLTRIGEFAQQNGYDVIVSDGVLYASSRVNVTDQILALLGGGQGQ